ncbi:metallophosphoesterase family protein [Asticcacaulis benevestitus]|nr:metallophosphoesterase family protein [Asticcacaulis benevestitus]
MKTSTRLPQIDRVTYAIGDIHGCNDLFIKLLATIQADATELGEVPRLVLLGDYVDRGTDSSGVLDTILELEGQTWCELHVLLGNHEMMLKRFLLESDYGADWAAYGGAATLSSYNVPTPHPRAPEEAWEEARRALAQNMPDQHGKLLDRAELKFIAGDYLFVHGGVKPGVPLDEQKAETLLWIRDEFLSAPKACDYVVVHGHSAREDVMQTDWRIGVDTGAYATGVLTAVRLRGSERVFINASR